MKPGVPIYNQKILETKLSEISESVESTNKKLADILDEVRSGAVRQLIFVPSSIAIVMAVAYSASGTYPTAVPLLVLVGIVGLVTGLMLPATLITKKLRFRWRQW